MLIHFGVIPYVVFDGDYLPSKAATEVDRAKRREESKRRGLELYRLNKPSQAHLELQKAVDVTPEMAKHFIDELKKIGVQYVVAPYEADAQLAYLERTGIIQGMLSEDSDLLVFGAKRLLTKLDQYGECIEINRADFTSCRDISLVGWSDAEFRRMAILSGCDYLASINKMGLKTAYRYVRKYKTIEKILRMLQFDGQYHVPTGYLQAFHKAELTFLHQRVFCPIKNDIVMMTDLAKDAQPEDFSYIGHAVPQEIAIGVAYGTLDPMTKQPILVKCATKTTPKTPWQVSRRTLVESGSENKLTKPIESFFKPKRTPLAELDQNTFTPSPTQERLLRQASRQRWESSAAPSRPLSSQPNPSLPSPAPLSTQSAMAAGPGNRIVKSVSDAAPLKRRRLCIDADVSQVTNAEVGRSKFFSSNTSAISPLIEAKTKPRRARGAGITIWSDDSIEEVMLELQDAASIAEPVKTVKLAPSEEDCEEHFEDTTRTEIRNGEESGDDSQSSILSKTTLDSEICNNTSATSVISSMPSVGQILNRHVTAEIIALTKKHAYQPKEDQIAVERRELIRREGGSPRENKAQSLRKPMTQRRRSMTPLQRLGIGALNKTKSCTTLTASAVQMIDDQNDLISSVGDDHLVPHIPILPNAHTIGPDASFWKGSEDLIVPDPENSADDSGPMSDLEETGKPKIDLDRFLFKG